ncbi:MAG: hypothetical protein HQ547_05725 [Candidatus Omnitrophica bacterium]|nr:hypothetical protein [Candidatus Omnitrophota bacterium]
MRYKLFKSISVMLILSLLWQQVGWAYPEHRHSLRLLSLSEREKSTQQSKPSPTDALGRKDGTSPPDHETQRSPLIRKFLNQIATIGKFVVLKRLSLTGASFLVGGIIAFCSVAYFFIYNLCELLYNRPLIKYIEEQFQLEAQKRGAYPDPLILEFGEGKARLQIDQPEIWLQNLLERWDQKTFVTLWALVGLVGLTIFILLTFNKIFKPFKKITDKDFVVEELLVEAEQRVFGDKDDRAKVYFVQDDYAIIDKGDERYLYRGPVITCHGSSFFGRIFTPTGFTVNKYIKYLKDKGLIRHQVLFTACNPECSSSGFHKLKEVKVVYASGYGYSSPSEFVENVTVAVRKKKRSKEKANIKINRAVAVFPDRSRGHWVTSIGQVGRKIIDIKRRAVSRRSGQKHSAFRAPTIGLPSQIRHTPNPSLSHL